MKSFPAKILLFGEYSILEGSMAMAVPYPTYSGHLVFYDTVPDNQVRESGIQLLKFCTFLKDRIDRFPFLDLDRFEEEINQGLSFNSNIHQGYGLGSSGALTAAVYERYCTKDPTLPVSDLRSRLASMESYFHGTSSGLDPLVSFTGEPVLIGKDGKVTLIKGNEWKVLIKETKAFLADTGTIGKTEGFVNWFKAQMQDINYAYTINQRYIPAVNLAIESLMKGHTVTFKKAVNTVSQLQRTLFLPMIPEPFHPYFEDGVTKKEFFLKLCGSGGGGFMLGFATEETEGKLMKYEFPKEPIFLFAEKRLKYQFLNQKFIPDICAKFKKIHQVIIAVIDLGTNTSNLVIAGLEDQIVNILYQGKEYVRLGDRQIAENVISNAAIARACASINRQVRISRKWGADNIRIIATSAVRQAVNRFELTDAIKEAEAIEVEVIDGEREAELIYQGVRLAIGTLPEPSIILDIGGGSNEVIISNDGSLLWRFSFTAGMSRIISQFPISDPITNEEIVLLEKHFEEVHHEAILQCRRYGVKTLIGCSGAFNTLADVLEGTAPEEVFRIHKEVSLNEFDSVYQQIIPSTTSARVSMKGMDMVRTELIVPALILTRTLINLTGIDKIVQTGYSLREGVLSEMIRH